MSFAHGHRGRLTDRDLGRFAGDTLFDRVARAVCAAGVLPRKELYESWEVARRVHRVLRDHPRARVVDVACGHGLCGALLSILDRRLAAAVGVDLRLPPSAHAVREVLVAAWPDLGSRWALRQGAVEDVALGPEDVVVSVHACGALTDTVLSRAADARAVVAVLPCCHVVDRHHPLSAWVDPSLAVDIDRVTRLRRWDYDVRAAAIPVEITPKNRLIIGVPSPTARATTPT